MVSLARRSHVQPRGEKAVTKAAALVGQLLTPMSPGLHFIAGETTTRQHHFFTTLSTIQLL